MKFYDDLIGEDDADTKLKFIGSDNEQMLDYNSLHMPSDWIYRKLEINYEHNKFGHRCNSAESIDLNNYILFAGCSHTYGVGLPLELTYAYKLSKYLQADYYNLSVGGADNYTIFNNLYYWGLKYPKPKLVIAQWTNPTRFSIIENGVINQLGINDYNSDINDFVYMADESGYNNLKMYLYSKIIESIYGIPVVHIGFFGNIINAPDGIVITDPIDRARDQGSGSDNGHYGIQTQSLIVKNIMKRPSQSFETVWDLLQKTR